MSLPSQAKLKEDFTYEPETGDFTRYDGKWGGISKTGYIRINYEGKSYSVHRLIWMWVYGEEPEIIDHINGDKQDNRLVNLRSVDQKTNLQNQKRYKNNKSGFNGVNWHEHTGKWTAQLKINGKVTHIGKYNTPQEAADARQEFIAEFMPFVFTDRHGK